MSVSLNFDLASIYSSHLCVVFLFPVSIKFPSPLSSLCLRQEIEESNNRLSWRDIAHRTWVKKLFRYGCLKCISWVLKFSSTKYTIPKFQFYVDWSLLVRISYLTMLFKTVFRSLIYWPSGVLYLHHLYPFLHLCSWYKTSLISRIIWSLLPICR